MKKSLSKNLIKYFCSEGNQNLTRAQIKRILKAPSFNHIKEVNINEPIEKVKKIKEKPQMIFDLNKTKIEDIIDYYNETQSIEEVNNKFNTNIRAIRYGLTIPNIDPCIKGLEELEEELNPTPLTSLENLYSCLELTGENSFDDYQNSLQKKFNFAELLGDEDEKNDMIRKKELIEYMIPYGKLEDDEFMEGLRKCYSFNISIPGVVELEDPNRFLENLRPIEEFRHTPVVPISEAEMKRFEEEKKRRKLNRIGFVYSYEKFATLAIFITSILIGGYLIKLLLKKDEEMMMDFYRNKLKRINK